ncbi:putative uncharacterized oxidoreductase [Trichoplax sp. H2]|uniref:NAD-dependent epimerase/dehydratase domain-containing protein n=1 Tax=Trichoplax adhaerens TaxID=10228 RepID=B3RM42_TRIAD|nr:hypothetical protein TRIADDRAFT_52229 [Trichoplax adhaerens]EDV29632.1 hypothetical protein TRIADDRAFT_52229 [Trichoplax adhaerens]RDD46689.1 putative uncharacterized oxidoreductase [Trichoplax sp. H2]|eukprot:XP_002108834.1 hypothetical protein TRIADDRAFT_52229 [Trichoplax adhaerens]
MSYENDGQPITLVTGASGFLASHIVQQLLQKGLKVRGTVRSLQNQEKVEPLRQLSKDSPQSLELVEADLLNKDSWIKAVEGCTYVCHVASPFPIKAPNNEMDLIKPAVDGTKAVLEACSNSGTVKRVSLTSSIAAIIGGVDAPNGTEFTEENWGNAEKASAYAKSKILAEKAAWEFIKDLPESKKFELVVFNPGYIQGPVIRGTYCSSLEVVMRLMKRAMPAVPKMSFAIVDVRDVAAAHIAGLTAPKAAGNRYILVSENMWMGDVGQALLNEFKTQGYNPPTATAPYFLLWTLSWFDKSLATILPNIGHFSKFNNTKAKEDLEINFKSAKESVIDMAYSMIERDFIKKTPAYKGRN